MATIFGETRFFLKNWVLNYYCRDTLWVKNFVEIALSCTVFKIQAFLCFAIFAKNSKLQNGRQFWIDKKFVKFESLLSINEFVEMTTFLCLICFAKMQGFTDESVHQNRSISLCFQDKCVFAIYAEIQNDFCKKSPVDSTDTLGVKYFVKIALSRSVSGFCI